MQSVTCITHVLFIISTTSEVARPVGSFVISIGEDIVVLCGPRDIFGGHSIDVHLRRRVDEFNVGLLHPVGVPVLNHSI